MDKYSLIDYLLSRRIAAGYSFYKNVFRISQKISICSGIITKNKYFYIEVNNDLAQKSSLEFGSLISQYLNENIFKLKNKEICSYFSGGLDSRFILASASNNIDRLFTVGFSKESREIASALEVSDYVGKPHTIELSSINSLKNIHYLALQDAKYAIQANSLFRIFNPPSNFNFICGIGLDYLFQGMYTNFSSSKTFSPEQLNNTFFTDFLKNTNCKNRGFNKNILNKDMQFEFSKIIEEIARRRVYQVSSTFKGQLPLSKIYDLFLFSTPSAHYTFSDYLGMISKAPTFIPLCDNRFFTLFASMPEQKRKIDYH